jgi:hypothetical protein
MKVLNRPMFRMGGPIKEGIMSGIQEPRQGYRLGNTVDRTVGGAQMVFPAEINAMMPNASKVFADVAQTYQPIDSSVNTTDRYITVERKQPRTGNIVTQEIKNPDFIPKYKTITGPRIGERKVEITEDLNTTPIKTGTTIQDNMPDRKLDPNKDNTDPTPDVEETKKQRVDRILDSLGYKRAQKNALYDAMIKAGQRISRTGLGAENLVSDVIAETSQSYDKPEKLREAAELMSTQQDLKLEQIEASKDNRTNIEKLTEYYMSKEGGGLSLELAQRKARQLPTTLGEYFTASKAGTDLGKVRDATNQATRDGLFGEGKEYKGKIDKKKYKTVSEFIADQENFKGDGVYNVGGEAIVIENGEVVSRVVIQAKADKEGFFS